MSQPIIQKQDNTPILQFSVLCDGIAKTTNNKLILIGAFNRAKPKIINQFFIVNRWIYGKGTFKQKIIVKNPRLENVTSTQDLEFTLKEEFQSTDIIEGFVNTNLEQEGIYWIEIYLENKLVISYPLPVHNINNNLKT